MEATMFFSTWHPLLLDLTGERTQKPRKTGKTMVIDKGLGIGAFEDLIQTAGAYIDVIKLGFGTAALYPKNVLRRKINTAKKHNIQIMPGGTFLEIAVSQNVIPNYFETVFEMGFTGVEVSDGSISITPQLRKELIARGCDRGLTVYTEFGKKLDNTAINLDQLIETIYNDHEQGAELIIIEGRESGSVGIYNQQGSCQKDEFQHIVEHLPNLNWIMWEAPQNKQQLFLIQELGPNVHLGNIAPNEVIALEALRRGLRSDTFVLHHHD